MFNCEGFRSFDESLQLQLLRIDGIFLMERRTGKLKAELFALYAFYVETFFDEAGELLFIKSFEEVNGLHHYLKMIDVDHLFENME